jgi:glycosyltransferase involved in cell wall biosynthesis
MSNKPTVLYLSTVDWAFTLHRLPMARAARDAGFKVVVGTKIGGSKEEILSEGFHLVDVPFRRRETRPWAEADVFQKLWTVFREYRPDVIHNFSLKPVLYGSAVFRVSGLPASVNSITGMGHIFTGPKSKVGLLNKVVRLALKTCLRSGRSWAVVQNQDDFGELQSMGVPRDRIVVIEGSGVSTRDFSVSPEPNGKVVVTMVSRVLWDKGVGEFVEAAKILADEGSTAKFILVGDPDPENPASVQPTQIQEWHDSGTIQWLGHRKDINDIWSRSHIAVLPSYREGMPKVLLEAASCGRPIVTTDATGCREIVTEGENGFLVPVGNSEALADSIKKLIQDRDMRGRMGQAGRTRIEESYSDEVVAKKILALYRSIMNRKRPRGSR